MKVNVEERRLKLIIFVPYPCFVMGMCSFYSRWKSNWCLIVSYWSSSLNFRILLNNGCFVNFHSWQKSWYVDEGGRSALAVSIGNASVTQMKIFHRGWNMFSHRRHTHVAQKIHDDVTNAKQADCQPLICIHSRAFSYHYWYLLTLVPLIALGRKWTLHQNRLKIVW